MLVNGFVLFLHNSTIKRRKIKGIKARSPFAAIKPIAFAAKTPYAIKPVTIVGHKAGLTVSLVTIVTNSFKLRTVMIRSKTEKTVCPSNAEPTIAITKKTAVRDRVAKLFTFEFNY